MANPDINKITLEYFEPELLFSTSRSSGPGGQHVNKVNTKVELRFHIPNSNLLTEKEKTILLQKLKNKINKDGELIIVSQEDRSQYKNKEAAIEKFLHMLKKALTPVKKRRPSRPTRASKERRLEGKKLVSIKKTQRRKPDQE
jgi:ribosome-associated protein